MQQRKQEVCFQRTVQQLERVKMNKVSRLTVPGLSKTRFTLLLQIKSPQGRHQLQKAYMAYAVDPGAAKRALQRNSKAAN